MSEPWMWDASHFPRPVTAAFAAIYPGATAAGSARVAAAYGLPAAVEVRIEAPGWVYGRPSEGAGDEQRAARAITDRRWLVDAARWHEQVRPALVERGLALDAVDLGGLDDTSLGEHLGAVAAFAAEAVAVHFELHVADMVPTGRLLLAAGEAGVEAGTALEWLRGSSPHSTPGGACGDPVEAHRLHRARLVSGCDVDHPTEGELGGLARFRPGPASAGAATGDDPHGPGDGASGGAGEGHQGERWPGRSGDRDPGERWPGRSGDRDPGGHGPGRSGDGSAEWGAVAVPEGLEALMAEARATFGMRDDNSGVTLLWPFGLLRLALLEAGARRLAEPALAVEADVGEAADLLAGAGPAEEVLARRRHDRHTAPPPPRWVPHPPPPEPATVPAAAAGSALGHLLAAFVAYDSLYEAPEPGHGRPHRPGPAPLRGTGIGDRPVTGTAVVARSPVDACDRLTATSVLVVTTTAPAFDPVLPLAAAIVCEEGGLLCHAALTARELGIPAVVGVAGATTAIADGQLVTVDPVAGTVIPRAGDLP